MRKWKKIMALLLVVFATVGMGFLSPEPLPEWGNETLLTDVMRSLGQPNTLHAIDKLDAEKVQKGFEIVTTGRTTNTNGNKTRVQSKFFSCTSCHNIVKEDPDLANPNPEARLSYAIENELPFLQGTTLYGIVNRTSWYNDDYLKKYGDLVYPARDTLSNAVQLCAKECSQGRLLEGWELDAVMHYLWSIGFKLGDLNLSKDEMLLLNGNGPNPQKVALLQGKFIQKSPAHFLDPIGRSSRKFGKSGNPQKGEGIFQQSCMHCHNHEDGVADFKLDTSKMTFKMLKRHMKQNTDFSIYYITRKGTPPDPGYKPYMPHFPKERLSDAQIEDLVAYIQQESKR